MPSKCKRAILIWSYLVWDIILLTVDIARDLGTEVISVYVGPDRRRFVVHKQLLTSQSDYFDKALNGRFKEAEENEIHLEEDDPTAIGLMVGWLYRGVIPGTGNKASPFTRAICTSNENNQWLGPPLFPQSGTSVPFTPFLASERKYPKCPCSLNLWSQMRHYKTLFDVTNFFP